MYNTKLPFILIVRNVGIHTCYEIKTLWIVRIKDCFRNHSILNIPRLDSVLIKEERCIKGCVLSECFNVLTLQQYGNTLPYNLLLVRREVVTTIRNEGNTNRLCIAVRK